MFGIFVLNLLLAASTPSQSEASISITGRVAQPLVLKASDLEKMPRATVMTMNKGVETTYEGIWLSEALKKAGLSAGSDTLGYVIAYPAEGLPIIISFKELGKILLADKANGKPLFTADGAFRLVVPDDAVRSVGQLIRLDVVVPAEQK